MIDLSTYGYTGEEDLGECAPARVVAVHRERYELVSAHGPCAARLKSGVYLKDEQCEDYPTVGDFVAIEFNPSGDSRIVKTLTRRSIFRRADAWSSRGEQAVAANFDYVFIMGSLNQDYNLRRFERYLAAAWETGGTPIILLTKADLCEDPAQYLREVESVAPGVAVFAVSARTGQGMDALNALLTPGKTCVCLGMSGVGKSSLLNALFGETVMAVSEIRQDDARGRHTTTHRQLIMLPTGAMVIDTPGMREMGVWDADVGEVFTDIEAILARCRFADCAHESEPGCAIRAAIADGTLSEERLLSYKKLLKESEYAADRAAFLRKRQAWHKEIAKMSRARTDKRD